MSSLDKTIHVSTILEVNGLTKNYKKVKALDSLNLKVEQGMVLGILGPNGSGKTTTLGILLGVLKPTSGDYLWFGNGTVDSNRTRIGALLETPNFYPYLSAVQNLRIVGKIKEVENVDERIETVLKAVNLYERRDSKFKTYSLGMKQRLAIAAALLNDPEVLVLDEPTNGLDPQGISEIRTLIRDIANRGKTILLASHQLDEVEKVCTDVAIIKNGVLIRQSSIESVLGTSRQLELSSSDVNQLKSALSDIDGVRLNRVDGNRILADIEDNIDAANVNEQLFNRGVILSELKEIRKSLEDQFLTITKS